VYAKRLQIQERLTSQIADTLFEVLQPRALAVVIEAQHMCMTTRGVYKPGSSTLTQRMLGLYQTYSRAVGNSARRLPNQPQFVAICTDPKNRS
jgi:GTP cyclohydrolase I